VEVLYENTFSLEPGKCWKPNKLPFAGENPSELFAAIFAEDGECLLSYRPVDHRRITQNREVATQPPAPAEIASSDELYFTGEHLDQYRHATRSPESYWNEALHRDPGDARCNIAMGRRALKQGRWNAAEACFEKAVARLTRRHPNPETGEAHYFLGLTRVFKGEHEAAYPSFYKATWNQAWRSAAFYQLACLDCRQFDWRAARRHLDESLAMNADHTKAIVLQAVIARHSEEPDTAMRLLAGVLDMDPLDHWARYEGTACGLVAMADCLKICRNDAQTVLDLVFDYADAGFNEDAVNLLDRHLAQPVEDCAVPNPLSRSASCLYVLAWLQKDTKLLAKARAQSPDYFFPSRGHEQIVLEWALQQPTKDPVAAYGLGNYFYNLERYQDAITVWLRAVGDGASFATVFRNLGIATWNLHRDGDAARNFYLRALELDAHDPRLVSEYDQFRSKLNDPLLDRLGFLEERMTLVLQRDDCTVALASLYNLTNKPEKALEIMISRRFHPWEGGEGNVLRQFSTAHLQIGRKALDAGDASRAFAHFTAAMDTPESLGEAYHLLQAMADVNYWIGRSLKALGREVEARECFTRSANESGDFSDMAVTTHSPLSYFRGLSMQELGCEDEARAIFADLATFAETKPKQAATSDYFATSLPNLLVFDEDLQARRDAENHLLLALAHHGLGEATAARAALEKTLAFTCSEQRCVDLLRELELA
jgi:tetratricopeptide (TPR) repeat protein